MILQGSLLVLLNQKLDLYFSFSGFGECFFFNFPDFFPTDFIEVCELVLEP